MNQYHVVMGLAPRYLQDPQSLARLYVSTSGTAANGTAGTNLSTAASSTTSSSATTSTDVTSARNQATNAIANTTKSSASSASAVSTSGETMVPLSAFARYETGTAAIQVNHQGLFAAVTISFNLAPGHSLSEATAAVARAVDTLHMPASIQSGFAGSAFGFQSGLTTQLVLLLAALATIYLVLGILYESAIHPITILSTIPSAGVGAVLALLAFGEEFNIMAVVGVVFLIGIVKKNAILIIDFALDAERGRGLAPVAVSYTHLDVYKRQALASRSAHR